MAGRYQLLFSLHILQRSMAELDLARQTSSFRIKPSVFKIYFMRHHPTEMPPIGTDLALRLHEYRWNIYFRQLMGDRGQNKKSCKLNEIVINMKRCRILFDCVMRKDTMYLHSSLHHTGFIPRLFFRFSSDYFTVLRSGSQLSCCASTKSR